MNITVDLELGANNFTLSAEDEAENTNTPVEIDIEKTTDLNISTLLPPISDIEYPNGESASFTIPTLDMTKVTGDGNYTTQLTFNGAPVVEGQDVSDLIVDGKNMLKVVVSEIGEGDEETATTSQFFDVSEAPDTTPPTPVTIETGLDDNTTTASIVDVNLTGEPSTTAQVKINQGDFVEVGTFDKNGKLVYVLDLPEIGEYTVTVVSTDKAGNTSDETNTTIERADFVDFDTAFNQADFNTSNPGLNITYSQAPNGDLNATLPFGEATFVVPDINNTQNPEDYTTEYNVTYFDENGVEISSEIVNVGGAIVIPPKGNITVEATTTPVDTDNNKTSVSRLNVNVGAEVIVDSPTIVDVSYTTGIDPFDGTPIVNPTGDITSSDQLIEYIVVNGYKIFVNGYEYTFPGTSYGGTTLDLEIKLEGNNTLETPTIPAP